MRTIATLLFATAATLSPSALQLCAPDEFGPPLHSLNGDAYAADVDLHQDALLVGSEVPGPGPLELTPPCAYFYEWDGSAWKLEAQLAHPGGEDQVYGESAALAGDDPELCGARAAYVAGPWVDGATLDNLGSVATYEEFLECGQWLHTGFLSVPTTDAPQGFFDPLHEHARFGASLATDPGNTDFPVIAVVGAPSNRYQGSAVGSAFLFEQGPASAPLSLLELVLEVEPLGPSARFGTAVAVDGRRVFVGAPGEGATGFPFADPGPGAVFWFEYDGSSWSYRGQLPLPPAALESHSLGASLALDGDELFATASSGFPGTILTTRAHGYRLVADTWQHDAMLPNVTGIAFEGDVGACYYNNPNLASPFCESWPVRALLRDDQDDWIVSAEPFAPDSVNGTSLSVSGERIAYNSPADEGCGDCDIFQCTTWGAAYVQDVDCPDFEDCNENGVNDVFETQLHASIESTVEVLVNGEPAVGDTFCEGDVVTLVATGEGWPIRWYRYSLGVPDVVVGTGPEYSFTLDTSTDGVLYGALAEGGACDDQGPFDGPPATIPVAFFLNEAPALVSSTAPAGQVCSGTDIELTATFSGDDLALQWFRQGHSTPLADGQTLLGSTLDLASTATSTTLTVQAATASFDGESFYARATNDCGSEASPAATLDVADPPAVWPWIGPDGGAWNVAGHWSGCGLPGAALLQNDGASVNTAVVAAASSPTSATVGGGSQEQVVRIDATGELAVETALAVEAAGRVQLEGGTLRAGAAGETDGTVQIATGGRIAGHGYLSQQVAAPSLAGVTNAGSIEAQGGLLFLGANAFANQVGGAVLVHAGAEATVDVEDPEQLGDLRVLAGTASDYGVLTFPQRVTNEGSVLVNDHGRWNTLQGAVNANEGSIAVGPGASASFVALSATALVNAAGVVPNGVNGCVGLYGCPAPGGFSLSGGTVVAAGPDPQVHNTAQGNIQGYGVIQIDALAGATDSRFLNEGWLQVQPAPLGPPPTETRIQNATTTACLENLHLVNIENGAKLTVDAYKGSGNLLGGSMCFLTQGGLCLPPPLLGAPFPPQLDVQSDFQAYAPASVLAGPMEIRVEGDWDVAIDDPHRLSVADATLQLDGVFFLGGQDVELPSHDYGPMDNLGIPELNGIGHVTVGPNLAAVRLVDQHDNAGDASGEVLYARRLTVQSGSSLDLDGATVRVQELELESGATLILNGGTLYYETLIPADPCDAGVLIDDCGGLVESPPQDCDGNGVADAEEIALGLVEDCNGNAVPDGCDLVLGFSLDLDASGGPDDCQALSANVGTVSLSAGGTQSLTLDGGAGQAGALYVVLGTASGTSPGLPFGEALLPLNFDEYFAFTLKSANQAPLIETLGSLDVAGRGSAAIALPAGSNPGLEGVVLHHAFLVADPSTLTVVLASNAMPLLLEG